jgi:hypothetical protein
MYKAAGNPRHSERIATLVAAFVTFGCLVFFVLVNRPEKQPPRRLSSVPVATPRPSLDPPHKSPDPNQEFRSVPGRWASVDFKHYFYGRYKLSDGGKVLVNLNNGEYQYDFGDNSRGWFSLKDVYYFDITGDDIPDAIVDISHVECGSGSCDGGSDLLFIYQINASGRVKESFQYKTGSYAYGCGLKSMDLARKGVSLELFGRCRPPAMNDMGPGKFMVKDITYIAFWFSEKGFIQTANRYVSTDLIDVTSYKPEIRIHQVPANVIRP